MSKKMLIIRPTAVLSLSLCFSASPPPFVTSSALSPAPFYSICLQLFAFAAFVWHLSTMSNGNVTVAFHYSHYYCCCWCCYYCCCCCCSCLGPCCCCCVFCLLFGRQRGCHLWWRWWVLYSFLAVVVCLLCSLDLPLMTCIILWKFCVCLTSLASLSSPLFPIGFFGRLRKLFYAVVMPPSTAPAPCQLYFCCVIILLLLSTPLLHQSPPSPSPSALSWSRTVAN